MFALAPTATVNVAGCPAETCVVGAVMVIPVRGLGVRVTSAVLPAALAVTFAERAPALDALVAVNVDVATPEASVVAVTGFSEPLSALKVTGMPGSPAPDTSSTRALIVAVPPPA